MKPTCFLSYCHDGLNKNEILAIIEYFSSLVNYKIDFFYDLTLLPGTNLCEFEKKIDEVDAVICFLTKNFKNKIDNRIGGVYREFSYIENRYNSLKTENENDDENEHFKNEFYFVPIIYSGDYESSTPNFIKHNNILCENLVEFSFEIKDGKTVCCERSKHDFENRIKAILNNIMTLHIGQSKQFLEKTEEIYDKMYLKSILLDITKNEYIDLPENLHVKTRAFKRVLCQDAYFIIGRKGSGKTTVTDILEKTCKSKFKGVIKIIANEFDVESTYGYYQNKIDDIKGVINPWDIFVLVWSLYLHIYSTYIVCCEYENMALNDKQSEYCQILVPFVNNILRNVNQRDRKNETIVSRILYAYSVSSVFNYIDIAIARARNSVKEFTADIKATLSVSNLLDYIFTKKRINNLYSIFELCSKRILITLDGFDLKFAEYRQITLLYKSDEQILYRNQLENIWILSLMELCFDIKMNKKCFNPLYRITDVCLTIPHDKFIELRGSTRDIFKFTNRLDKLNWSGMELLILLRKRLEAINDYKTKKEIPAERRYEDVMQRCYPYIPLVLDFFIYDRKYTIGLFQYILRMSFWRPRDILQYMACVIAYLGQTKMQGIKITSDTVIKSIRIKAINIIKEEFFDEYCFTIPNIKEIANSFRYKNQLLSLGEVDQVLIDIDFKLVNCTTTYEKIRILYEIGFFGIYASSEYRSFHNLIHNHAFIFNEGKASLSGLETDLFQQCRIIIHPIFTEYLSLKANANEVLCNYSWDYLRQMELDMGNIDF